MGAIGAGRKQPDGEKIVELRQLSGLKQEVLAQQAGVSVRLLRDIERKNHLVRASIITDIATALKVPPEQIILSPDISSDAQYPQYPQLKLRPIQSASELSRLADEAHEYWWDLEKVDPTAATAKEMQKVLRIIRRLVERFNVVDEFDKQDANGRKSESPNDFGLIARLAQLQESLDMLRAAGVCVLAGSYYRQSLTNKEDKSPGIRLRRSATIRAAGIKAHTHGNTAQLWKIQSLLEIRFVPCEVNEMEICIDLGIPPDHPESLESLSNARGARFEPRAARARRPSHAQSQQQSRVSKKRGGRGSKS